MSDAVFKQSQTFEEFAEATKSRIDTHWHPMMDEECVCGPLPRPAPEPVVLNVQSGTYEVTGSRYPLLRLAVEVLKHRTWHFLRGEGFRD